MQRLVLVLGVFLAAMPLSLLQAAETITVPGCVLFPDEEVQVPAQEDGVLMKILVREGQQVAKGDLLVQIDDIVPRMQYNVAYYKLEVAKEQALNDIEVRYAKAGLDVATAKLRRSLNSIAITRKSVSDDVIDEQRLEKEKFRLSIEKADKDLKVAALQKGVSEAELRAAEANVKRRKIIAPLDAEVVELKSHEGEWVKVGDIVMRLVRLDLLRVHGSLDAKTSSPAEVQGRPVQITVALANGRQETFQGKIVYVKPLVEGGAYEVRAEVQNRKDGDFWLLSPGQSAEMIIQLKE